MYYHKAKKQDSIRLLKDKLPDSLSDKPKVAKIKYLLQKMRLEELSQQIRKIKDWLIGY